MSFELELAYSDIEELKEDIKVLKAEKKALKEENEKLKQALFKENEENFILTCDVQDLTQELKS